VRRSVCLFSAARRCLSIDPRRDQFAYDSGTAVLNLLDRGITARQIMSKDAFENAIAVVMALGGSTNAVLHLLAIATRLASTLRLDDFNRCSTRSSLGDTNRTEVHMRRPRQDWRIPVCTRALAGDRSPPRDVMTVSGSTMAESPRTFTPNDPTGTGARRRSPHPRSRVALPCCAVVGAQGRRSESGRYGRAVTFENCVECSTVSSAPWTPSMANEIEPQTVVVIRYEKDRKGGPGMREMPPITGAHERWDERDLLRSSPTDDSVAARTDVCVATSLPRRWMAGPIALVRPMADEIVIDVNTLSIDLVGDEADSPSAQARAPFTPRYTPACLGKRSGALGSPGAKGVTTLLVLP